MSSPTDQLQTLSISTNLDAEPRKVLGLAGNRVAKEDDDHLKKNNKKKDIVEIKTKSSVKLTNRLAQQVVVVKKNDDESVDSLCSSKSTSSSSSSSNGNIYVKKASSKKREKMVGDGSLVVKVSIPFKRCHWITQFSDPLHVSFHDEEWGVPVHEDYKLFELLVLSLASAELTWPEILYKRDKFRKLFENFDPSTIAKFPEDRLFSATQNGSQLLSEQKLRAVVGNAIAFLKIQQEFGSFSSYCWRFLNNKPIKNAFRYARQVPAKTPKSELISKDLMKRGFCCVGPIVIYSFMQISGMVNDHLISCFRYTECNSIVKRDVKPIAKETKQRIDILDDTN
uniref:probable GMP synthase [glutamine-hydrolyzing] n=1 Tax=Erigeron canadensis TaxID=72917 RepID=UPI001CB9BB51|nr:probable GMP synthase [glutamine-hydrolyzing] [Erigeron canadensis]